ncbi:MAG: membrane protein insertion efficiency factor YidD [Gammaproteobacteria bacterium]|nr:membrane protein insertion efficiency factor YidD [Gammaproteobacteria bacterium]
MAARLADKLVRGYQLLISPVLGPRCRFHPTCSEYARESLRRFGFWRGGWLTIRRIVRCQPFCEGGYDPVPAEFSWSGASAESPE